MPESSIVRELVTLLGFDADDKALKKYEERIVKVKKNLTRFTIVAGLAGAAITAIARQTAIAGDTLLKTSQRLGMSTKALQEWRFIAERSKISAESMDTVLEGFVLRMGEIARFGTGAALPALQLLDVQLRDSTGALRDIDDVMTESLKKLAAWGNVAERNALATKLFGAEGTALVLALANGEEGIESLRERFAELGGEMDAQTAQLGVDAMNAWTDFRTALNGVIFAMGKQLLPMLTRLINTVAEWLAKNHKLISTIAWVTLGVASLTATVFAGLVVWHTWAAAIALVNTGLVLMVAKAAAIIAIIAALALLGEDIGLFLRGGADTVTGRAIGGLKAAVAVAIDFWKREIINFVTVTLPAKITKAVEELFTTLEWYWNGFVELVKSAIDAVIPPEVREVIKQLAGFGGGAQGLGMQGEQTTAFAGLTPQQAALWLRQQGPVGVQGGPAEVNINISQTPGETGAGVAVRVAESLLGEGVTTPLNGLSR